jgi:hypothetical protein
LTMLYGPVEESNFREAGSIGPVVSSGLARELAGRKP